MRREPERDLPSLVFKLLRSAFAVLMMAYALFVGLSIAGRGLAHLPGAVRSGDLPSALGVVLVVSLCAALFSVGARLWIQDRSSHPEAATPWQCAFKVSCSLGVAVMVLILTVSIVSRM